MDEEWKGNCYILEWGQSWAPRWVGWEFGTLVDQIRPIAQLKFIARRRDVL